MNANGWQSTGITYRATGYGAEQVIMVRPGMGGGWVYNPGMAEVGGFGPYPTRDAAISAALRHVKPLATSTNLAHPSLRVWLDVWEKL